MKSKIIQVYVCVGIGRFNLTKIKSKIKSWENT